MKFIKGLLYKYMRKLISINNILTMSKKDTIILISKKSHKKAMTERKYSLVIFRESADGVS